MKYTIPSGVKKEAMLGRKLYKKSLIRLQLRYTLTTGDMKK
jgi:hypothetical protein